MKESLKFDYNSVQSGYYDHVFKAKHGIQSKWHHLKFNYLRSLIGDFECLLDIGCGPGTFLGLLDAEEIAVGIDISCDQIKYAQSNYGSTNHYFINVDSTVDLPFQDGAFDVVTVIELIEHISYEDAVSLIKEIRRILKPGGRLIVTTPNYAGLWPFVEWGINWILPITYEDQHITHYTKKSLSNLFYENGFSEHSISTFMMFAPFTSFMGWYIPNVINKAEMFLVARKFGLLLVGQTRKNI